METEELAPTKTLGVNAYRDGLTREQMIEYLSVYPDKAQNVVEECPGHRLLVLGVDGMALKGVKKSEQTLEEVTTALRQDGRALQYVSKIIIRRNPHLYKLAVESNGLALPYVPADHYYEGIYEDAIRSNPCALKWVPEEYQDGDLFLKMVEANGWALGYVPKRRISKKLSNAAFASDVRAIKYIPGRFCDRKMALAAVSSYGSLLKYVPERLIDDVIASTAVSNDGRALENVPDQLKTSEMCRIAVEVSAESICYVPPRFFDELAYAAVCRDWRAIRFITKRSRKLLSAAFAQSPLALEYFPPRGMTDAICEEACLRDPSAFQFVPRKKVSVSMLVNWLSSFLGEDGKKNSSLTLEQMKSLKGVDKQVLRDSSVAELMRRLGKREVKSAKWDEKNSSFLVTEVVKCGWVYRESSLSPNAPAERHLETFNMISRVSDLDSLSSLLGGDLSQVEFRGYSFEDYDPSRHDISSADVPMETLRRIGAYDDTAYRRLVSAWGDVPELHNPKESTSLACVRRDLVPPDRFDSGCPFYYVSDLHLNHMLKHRFPKEATKHQIADFLSTLAGRMVETAPESERSNVLFILGDTSYNIDVTQIFFEALRKAWKGRIVCVLGNHELWDWSAQGPIGRYTPTVDTVVDKYREMLSNLGIWLLQNEVMVLYRDLKPYRIREWQLDKMDDEELASLMYRSSYVILGGLGFSGFCDEFNAEDGIYRDVVTSRAEDITLSEKFSSLHERIRRLAPLANVIVATHTPMSNWSPLDYQPGWVYVSGHTHRNTFLEDGDIRAYADNQVGYNKQAAGLLRFYVEGYYDPFRHLPDGIHEIERVDYLDFNRSKGIHVDSFTREGQIFMLKRESVYLFLLRWEETGQMYLLSGGKISSLEVQNPNYYYERMLPYARLVKVKSSSYMEAIRTIAQEVKEFGGEGRVHGCIVDIDFFNHVYLDPFTGTLKFYYATSTVDRIAYEDLDVLLKNHLPRLLSPYKALLREKADGHQLLVKGWKNQKVAKVLHETSTLMYRSSNVVRSVQHLFESNVIRIWSEDMLTNIDAMVGELQEGSPEE